MTRTALGTLLVIVGLAAGVVYYVGGKVKDAIDDVREPLSRIPSGSGSNPGSGAAAPTTDPAAPSSLIRAASFAGVLAQARETGGPQAEIVLMRLDAGQAFLQMRTGASGVTLVVRPGQEPSRTPAPVPAGLRGSVPLSRLRPGDPERVLRATARRDRDLAIGRVSYMVLLENPARRTPGWTIFFRPRGSAPSRYVLTDLTGERIEEPARPGAGRRPAQPTSPEAARRIAACVRRAGQDPARIRACVR